MRISDWSSDVCSSDLLPFVLHDKQNRLSGPDLETLRLEIVVAHHNLDGSACFGCFDGLAEGLGTGVSMARSGLFTGMSTLVGTGGKRRPRGERVGRGGSCTNGHIKLNCHHGKSNERG